MHCGKKWWIREFVAPYIFPLNPDYVAARSLRSLRSNYPCSDEKKKVQEKNECICESRYMSSSKCLFTCIFTPGPQSAVRSLQSAVYVLLWPVTKNIEMSLLFILFVGAIPFLWILSPIDVTLYFNGLGIFDCISRACWSKCMCGQRTVDVLYRWIIELTIWAPRSQTSNEEKSHT